MSTMAHTVYSSILDAPAAPAVASAPLPADAIEQAVAQAVAVNTALDLMVLAEPQRRLLQNPNTADACGMARTMVLSLRIETEAVQAAGVDLAQVDELCQKHDGLRHGAHVAAEFLERVDGALLGERNTRAEGRERIRAYLEGVLGRLQEDDPEYVRLFAARSYLEAAEAREQEKEEAPRLREDKAARDVLSRLREAEADLQLGEVQHQLRTGQTPEYAALRKAALHLAEKETRRAER